MFRTIGYINIVLLCILALPFVTRMVNKLVFHYKSDFLRKLLKYLNAVHKTAAALFMISIVTHAYLAFGTLTLHTGTIVAASFIITALLGLSFYLSKKPILLKIHRIFLFISLFLLAVHLLMPNLLGE